MDRKAGSIDVLDLSLPPSTIFANIKAQFGQILNNELLDLLEVKSANDCYADTADWLPNKDVLIGNLVEHFKQNLRFVVGYHGCRPTSVAAYYHHGILSHDLHSLVMLFREKFSDVDSSHLDKAIELNKELIDEHGKVFFCAKEEDFDVSTNHYLLYGSERILGLARTLERECGYPDKFVSRLRSIGVPTIFKVRLPVSQFTDYETEAIVKEIATFWVKNKLSPNDIHKIDYCYLVYGDVEGSNVLEHKHPEKIQCPYTHIIYKTRLPNPNDEIQGHA